MFFVEFVESYETIFRRNQWVSILNIVSFALNLEVEELFMSYSQPKDFQYGSTNTPLSFLSVSRSLPILTITPVVINRLNKELEKKVSF